MQIENLDVSTPSETKETIKPTTSKEWEKPRKHI